MPACVTAARRSGFLPDTGAPEALVRSVWGWSTGTYCLGCCWFLMALLFFGGVMNLWWIGGLAANVLMEKVSPMGHRLGYIVGFGLIAWGAYLLMPV